MQYWTGRGGAGMGKSVSARHIAWEALCLYPSPSGRTPTGLCTVGVILHAPHKKTSMCIRGCMFVCM